MNAIAEARPASTVVLLRDSDHGLETLLLRRNRALMFAGGLWVFPGGAVDPADVEAARGDTVEAARRAAVREAEEEAGLRPRLEDMVQLSHWTTPEAEPRRFATWFFAAPIAGDGDEASIDGGEIHDSRWIPVREAVAAHERGELGMLPPTYVNLLALSRYRDVEEMLAAERQSVPPRVFPRVAHNANGLCALFSGDAGYASGDADTPGARHRAWLQDGRLHYLYEGVDPAIMPLVPELADA